MFSVRTMFTGGDSTDENIPGKYLFIKCWGLLWAIFGGSIEGNKVTSSRLEKKIKRQTTFHENDFNMNFYEKNNGLSSNIICTYSSRKQDKHY